VRIPDDACHDAGRGDQCDERHLESRGRLVRAIAFCGFVAGAPARRRRNEADAHAHCAGQLFEENSHPKQAALDQTIDAIRTQFGSASIQRGSLVDDLDAADDS